MRRPVRSRPAEAKAFPTLPSVALFRSTMTPLARVLWKPRLEGRENFPTSGPCFIYGNHSNRWDPFVINCFTRWSDPTAGLMTREFFRNPFLARLFRGAGILPASKRLAEPFLVRRVLELLQRDRMVVIFPEGGARWDGRPLSWMAATVKLFVRAGVPIHPIRIHGSYAAFPRWADYPRPSQVTIEALPPITFDRRCGIDEAMAKLRAITDFDENLVRPECSPSRAFKPAAGIHRLLYRDPWNDSGPLVSVGGRLLRTPSGSHSFKMLPDSRMLDQTDGTTYSAADLYARIRSMPLPRTAASGLLDDNVDVHHEYIFPNLTSVGSRRVQLRTDCVSVGTGSGARTIPLDDITYCDIERNFKLQLYLRNANESMIQFSFVGSGSALQWKDTLERLNPELVGLGDGKTDQES